MKKRCVAPSLRRKGGNGSCEMFLNNIVLQFFCTTLLLHFLFFLIRGRRVEIRVAASIL